MQNQSNQGNQENTTFNDQADGKFDKVIKGANPASGTQEQQKLSKGVTSDVDEMNSAESQVRATEDASLQDDSYAFDEANTDNEEYHDAGDASDVDLDSEDDFIQ